MARRRRKSLSMLEPQQLPLLLPADPARLAALVDDLIARVGGIHPTEAQADDRLATRLVELQRALGNLTGHLVGQPRHHGGSVHSIQLTAALFDMLAEDGIELPQHVLPLIPFSDFVVWARAQRKPATVRDIIRRFGCGRWTAYYWHRQLYGDSVPRGGQGTRA